MDTPITDPPSMLRFPGVEFEVVTMPGSVLSATRADHFKLPKSQAMVDRYVELSGRLPERARIVELGVFQGASTVFLLKQFPQSQVLAVELRERGSTAFVEFLANNPDDAARLHVMWGVDQADATAITAQLDGFHAGEPLDLVIDDASHLYAPTRASFETLFPRLRPGSPYVIEDWRWEHVAEGLVRELDLRRTDRASIDDKFVNAMLRQFEQVNTPTSRLVMELAALASCRPDVVAEVHLSEGIAEFTRGPAELPHRSFDIGAHLGAMARQSISDG